MTTQTPTTNIVYSIWGYSMTIIDYYEIVKETAKTVILRKIEATHNETGFLSGKSVPIEDMYEKNREGNFIEIRAYKREFANETTFISNKDGFRQYFHIWDGKPRSYNHCD